MTNIHLLGLMSTTFVQSLYGPEKDIVIFHSLFYILYSYFLCPDLPSPICHLYLFLLTRDTSHL